ncbi:glycosyltransferase 61 family protein [Methylobacterium sp. CM6246]
MLESNPTIVSASIASAKVQSFGNMHSHNGGPFIENTGLWRLRHLIKDSISDTFDEGAVYHDFLEGEWNYVGPAFTHFGHAMAESTHRILQYLETFNCGKWLLVGETNGKIQLPSALVSALEFFEIKAADVCLITKNTIVERLNLCKQGASFAGSVDSDYLRRLNSFTRRRLDFVFGDTVRPKKIFVTRAAIKHGGNILGESYIASFFEGHGFSIVYPEDHDLSTQMDYYRKAEVIVFPEGSACHGLEFLGNLNQIWLLQRRPETGYIFDALVRPRTSFYERLPITSFVGTIARHPYEERELGEWGVSILDREKWVSSIERLAPGAGRTFDFSNYRKCAANDFDDYIAFHRKAGTRLVEEGRIQTMQDQISRLA